MTENGAPSGALFLSSGQNPFEGLASQTSSMTAIVFHDRSDYSAEK
jgi:hypothetical protein